MRLLHSLLSFPQIKAEPKYTNTQQKVWDAISEEPISAADIATITGIPNRSVQKALSTMLDDLKVIDVGRHKPRLYYK